MLHCNVFNDKVDVVRGLIDKNFDLEAVDNDGWGILHYVAHNESYGICELLVQNEADESAKITNSEYHQKYTVLLACKTANVSLVTLFLNTSLINSNTAS